MWSNTLSVVNVQLLAAICFVRLDGQLTNISTVIVNTTTTTSPVPTIVKPGASSATSVLTPNPKRAALWP
ncbi:hypothetical protein RRG08_041277 [Elysia crispata]|uniref:Secreted protein n=1 Tax=Elysia crispata TaxID=231223 RepID=A0AAE0YMI9_9GAST|nr:hypothetical protein RRG08_041277 [Elysia crispata]